MLFAEPWEALLSLTGISEAVVTPCRTQDLLGEGKGLGFGHLNWRPELQ